MNLDLNLLGSYASISDLLLTLLALISPIIFWLWSNRRRRSWIFVRKEIKKLYSIMNTNYSPDAIVSIGREGTIIASLLAINYRIKPLLVLERDFTKEDGKTKAYIYDTLLISALKNKKILLVDFEVNSGASLNFAKQYLESKKVREIRTLVFMQRAHSNVSVDYCNISYKEKFYMPWEWSSELKLIRHGPAHARFADKPSDFNRKP